MALKRNKSNIVNLALAISNEDGKAGMTVDQTILNGRSMAVSFRLSMERRSLARSNSIGRHAQTLWKHCKRYSRPMASSKPRAVLGYDLKLARLLCYYLI